jgi:peptidoglycan/xylan/chitin deacetylase (PgdA/CDA1 family)
LSRDGHVRQGSEAQPVSVVGSPVDPTADALSRRGFLKITAVVLGQTLLGRRLGALAATDAPPVLWHGSREQPALAVTIDDCHSLSGLHELEDVLSDHPELTLTLFPAGRALVNTSSRDPDLWPRLAARGVEIGYHGFEHQRSSLMSVGAMSADFDRWLEACSQAVGETPAIRFARPPYGERGYSFLELCRAHDFAVAMWSAEWSGARVHALGRISAVQQGDIVLLHTRLQDIDNLRTALAILADLPLCYVTLSRLQGLAEGPRASTEVCAPAAKRGLQKSPAEARGPG